MRTVTYSLGVSLDSHMAGPDGDFQWGAPDDELFGFITERFRDVDVHLLGRKLYETMLYWENPGRELDVAEQVWAELWKAVPKVVFSRTLTSVEGTNTRLASGTLAEEVAQLKAEPGDGEIALGGPILADEAAALDLIDEYQLRVSPVLVGGGRPFFAQRGRRVQLELVENRAFGSGVVYLRYRVVR